MIDSTLFIVIQHFYILKYYFIHALVSLAPHDANTGLGLYSMSISTQQCAWAVIFASRFRRQNWAQTMKQEADW